MPRAIGVFEKAGFDVVANPEPIERLDRETGGNGTWTLEADSGFSRLRCTNGLASPYTGQPEGSIVCSPAPASLRRGNALLGRLQDTARHSRAGRRF